jgi:hypothetical protein
MVAMFIDRIVQGHSRYCNVDMIPTVLCGILCDAFALTIIFNGMILLRINVFHLFRFPFPSNHLYQIRVFNIVHVTVDGCLNLIVNWRRYRGFLHSMFAFYYNGTDAPLTFLIVGIRNIASVAASVD